MSIYIYNSLTQKKEEFIPQQPNTVKMYTCGVTVYDECHLGHARSLYIFEVIRRYFKYRGFNVIFVRNITDIDDKIIKRAKETNTSWQEVSSRYIDSYYEDLKLLGIEKADFEPRATENIGEMIEAIKILIEKKIAYITESGVYFRVGKFKEYGKLSHQNLENMLVGVRVAPDEKKEHPLDFALWKISSEDEPAWPSPWGRGRPGWHIECSVMSLKYLNTETLDIHAGGRDLIFPHHENEIAQSESITEKPFCRYWLHHGLLTINKEKMAKSLGNFISIKDFYTSYKNLDILKLFFLTAHYSNSIDYTEEKILDAKRALERIFILWQNIRDKTKENLEFRTKISSIENIKERFIQAMDDDFNMPQGLACIFDLISLTYQHLQERDFVYSAKETLRELLDIFIISPNPREDSYIKEELDKEYIESLITKRESARKNKDFILADKIREELEQQGIILEDTKEGTRWRKKI